MRGALILTMALALGADGLEQINTNQAHKTAHPTAGADMEIFREVGQDENVIDRIATTQR